MSRTNIDLDDKLVKEGLSRLKCHTKKELIHLALRELLRQDRRRDILQMMGKVRWEGDLRSWRRDPA